jgi:hypothetical protein
MQINKASDFEKKQDTQYAKLAISFGQRANLTAEIAVTTSGLLAIGILVSGILLSAATIVRVAK